MPTVPPPIKATYSFPQEPAIVTSSVSQHIDALLNVGVDPDHILDIYLDARRYAQINNARAANSPILNPYRYLRKTDGMTTEQLRVSANALESAYNAAVLTWQHVASLNYLSQYHAYMHKGYNDSGFENGMLSQRLFTPIGETNRLLLVDPSPSFLLHIANHPDLVNRPITMVFSDSRYADICNQHPWPQSIAIADTDHLDDNCNHIRTACIIATTTEYGGTIQLLNQVRSAGIGTILLVCPLRHFTGKRKAGKLRKLIATDLDLRQVVLASYELPNNHESGSGDDAKIERCILVMYNLAPSSDDINVETVTLQDNTLAASQSVLVSYKDFAECRRTLGALYRQAISAPSEEPVRKSPEPIYYAPEICFWHRIETIRKEGKSIAYRAVYRFYDYPSIEQQRRNKYARGIFIAELIGPLAASPTAAVYNLDDLILPNTDDEDHVPGETASIIRNTVSTHYGTSRDLSLKTFWFQHLPELLKSEEYNHKLCCGLFLGPTWEQNPLCHIIVNDSVEPSKITDKGDNPPISKTQAVQGALAAYAAATNASPTHQALILDQLHLIWQYDLRTHRTRSNPIAPLIDTVTDRENTKEEQREALALRAWTPEQMQALVKLIAQTISYKPMALAILLKLSIGISSGELSALVIDSFDYSQRTLSVTHNMPQTGAESNEYGSTSSRQKLPHIWKKRVYSIPDQLADDIQEMIIHNRINLHNAWGISEKIIGSYPLFPKKDDPTRPILTRRINERSAELVDQLNIPPWIISCSDDEISTDLNKYGGDPWASNWRFHARNTMHLDSGSVNYLSGTKPDSVADSNYRDFTLRFQRRKFQLAHEKYLSLIQYAGHVLQRIWSKMTLHQRRRSIPYNPHPTTNELVITYDADVGDDVELTVDVPHGCYIDIRYE